MTFLRKNIIEQQQTAVPALLSHFISFISTHIAAGNISWVNILIYDDWSTKFWLLL